MKKIMTVIGARPQFIKAAAVSQALANAGITEIMVHSGQHFDANMSDVFWAEMAIPAVKYRLNLEGGGHAKQTAQIMVQLEELVLNQETNIDAILVYGDTNTTLAVALVASKLNIPIVHVEAGLRSFNRQMPEEINRIVTDTLSTLLFCTSSNAVQMLKNEGITKGVHNVGDVMYDAFCLFSNLKRTVQLPIEANTEFSIFTLHRQGNTETAEQVNKIIKAFAALPHIVLWPVHPRIKNWKNQLATPDNVRMVDPFSYFEMLEALKNCTYVFTDSGGLQKEAYWAKKQCFTLRNDTEWIETLKGGWNTLVDIENINIEKLIANKPISAWQPLYGNGNAAQQIAAILKTA